MISNGSVLEWSAEQNGGLFARISNGFEQNGHYFVQILNYGISNTIGKQNTGLQLELRTSRYSNAHCSIMLYADIKLFRP